MNSAEADVVIFWITHWSCWHVGGIYLQRKPLMGCKWLIRLNIVVTITHRHHTVVLLEMTVVVVARVVGNLVYICSSSIYKWYFLNHVTRKYWSLIILSQDSFLYVTELSCSTMFLQIERKLGRRTPTWRSFPKLEEQEDRNRCSLQAWIPRLTPPPAPTWPSSATHWLRTLMFQVGQHSHSRYDITSVV